MVKIAIKGHASRGKEIIQILESLGGKNTDGLEGTYATFYYIDDENEICDDHKDKFPPTYKLYTLDEFEKEFPYKVGDKVKHSYSPSCIGTVANIIFDDYIPYRVNIEGKIYTCATMNLKPYKEMKEERNITLTLDKAKEWYNKGGELKEIALQAFSEKELTKVDLPKTWEEFCDKYSKINDKEYFINADSNIEQVNDVIPTHCRLMNSDRNICPSKKSAEAHLAMIQLEQLRDCWRQGWEPIWDCSEKWCIRLWGNGLTIGTTKNISRFLTFPTKEMAEEFLKCFRDLIEKAGDLI